jgi:hypothetical protein
MTGPMRGLTQQSMDHDKESIAEVEKVLTAESFFAVVDLPSRREATDSHETYI